ncbi:MAG: glycosyltransferase family 39 protein [Proteobacteria bacterium]|nr:glycosyltransferase family 39 protein [Pseudomonadota bacterium]
MRETAGYAPEILTAVLAVLACLMAARGVVTARRRPEGPPTDSNGIDLRVAALLAVAIAVSVAPIFGFWFSGRSTGNALGGLLPWNDAMGYFTCAHNILDGGDLSGFCQRRPLYTLFLSTLTAISGRDLQIALLVQGALFGAAAFSLARVVHVRFGTPAALISFAVLLGMAGQYTTATMTENAGLLYGIFGIYFLWRGAGTAGAAAIAAGAFLLTLGLNARAGAFFVLPALVIWAAVAAHERRRVRIAVAMIAVAAILGGFLFNYAALATFGGDVRLAQSNFADVLYGVTAGGKRWTQIYTDHPEIFEQGQGKAAEVRKIYAAALDNVVRRPRLFAEGYLRGLAHYVYAQFRYVEFQPLRFLFILLWWLGLATALRRRKERHHSLLLAMAIGIITSAPFITWDAGSRVYAATLPVDALIVALGLFAVQAFFVRRFVGTEPAHTIRNPPLRGAVALATAITVAAFPVPLMLRPWTALSAVVSPPCEDGRPPIVMRSGLESPFLRLAAKGETSLFPLNVSVDGFRDGMTRDVHLGEVLARLPAGTVFLWGYQLLETSFGTRVMLIWEDGTPPAKGKTMRICAKSQRRQDLPDLAVVESAQTLPN